MADNKKTGFKDVGKVLSQSEVEALAKAKGITPAEVISKAIEKNIGIGSRAVNTYAQQGNTGFGNYVYAGTPDNLDPLKGLTIPKGTAYYGSSSQTTPGGNMPDGQRWSATTTYTPVVLPRDTVTPSTANNNQNNQDNQNNQNNNDPYQSLRDQIEAAKQTIEDLKNQPVQPYPDLSSILAQQEAAFATQQEGIAAQTAAQQQALQDMLQQQQTSAAAQQEAMSAQAAQQQQALQDLMIQQQQAYETQMAEARQREQAMAAQAAEAQRQAMAVANAYVPGLEPTAASPVLGDARNMTRTSAANTLSNLSILTGLGTSGGVTSTTSNPLAGLQIA